MMRFPSLRVRLILLVLLAVIPALGLILYTGLEQRRLATEEIQETALRLARLVSNRPESFRGPASSSSVSRSFPSCGPRTIGSVARSSPIC